MEKSSSPEMQSMIITNDSPRVLREGTEQVEFSLPIDSHEEWLETGTSTHFAVSPSKKREGYNRFVEINPNKKKKDRIKGEHAADKELTPDNFFDFDGDENNPNKAIILASLASLVVGGVAVAYLIARNRRNKQ